MIEAESSYSILQAAGNGSDGQSCGLNCADEASMMDASLVQVAHNKTTPWLRLGLLAAHLAAQLKHFSYLCGVGRGPGGPRDSRPGGRRYLFFQRPATLSHAGYSLYTNRKNALKPGSSDTARFLVPSSISALCLLALLPLTACGPKPQLAADQPVAVRVRAPNRVQEPVSVAASGAVEANVTAQAAFQIAGRVARVLVEEGQPVAKGQVLAELDATDYRNAYDAAQGQADAAQATDKKAQAGLRPQELEQARIDFEQRQDEYKRMKFLYEHKSLAANDFEKIEAAYKAAQQRYEMARQGTRVQDKEAASGQYRAAAAQMHEAKKRMADCQLRAPIAGFVGMRRIDVGDTVGAGTPVISVLDLNPVKVRVAVPESEIGKVREGARATVTIPSLDGQKFDGKVETVGVAADAASRTYTAKIAVQNPQRLLRAGMVSEARIYSSSMVNAITVPGDAIVRDPKGVTHVYVYEPGQQRVYTRRVDVGTLIDNEVEILKGLSGNEQVVVAGQQNVREGSPARITGGGQ